MNSSRLPSSARRGAAKCSELSEQQTRLPLENDANDQRPIGSGFTLRSENHLVSIEPAGIHLFAVL
jgi:hypothetical protein